MRKFVAVMFFIAAVGHAESSYVKIPAGEIRSVIKYEDNLGEQKIATFELMQQPVTNAEFLAFVHGHPEWQRDRVLPIFAEKENYLSHWEMALALGATAHPQQPVTQVSWFAASAYCEAQGARLPTWLEWEYVSAADETRHDARSDPVWREEMLGWYAKNSKNPLATVGQSAPNVYGLQDLHGLIWEWVEDYAAMLASGDNRTQSDPDRLKFCGAGALSMEDRENYAVMMRVAMLSALEAVNSTSSLGFRCARNLP